LSYSSHFFSGYCKNCSKAIWWHSIEESIRCGQKLKADLIAKKQTMDYWS